MEDCPAPAVGEALVPFIRTTYEVLKIRNDLQTYLANHLKLEDNHLDFNNLTTPSISPGLTDAPPGLSGVRKAYWYALRAHQEAQARYAALKAEIQELSRSQSTSHTQSEAKIFQESVLPVLRQREKQRKLHVVERALSNIANDAAGPINMNQDDFIKSRAGEMPVLPGVSSTRHGYMEDADARMLDMKKAILTAKHVLDEHKAGEDYLEINGNATPTPRQELYALQQTRNMLITWIEGQLTLIGDAQVANEKPSENLAVEGEDAPIPVSKDEIGQIYEQYLAARKRLLQGLQHPPRHDFNATSVQNNGRSTPVSRTGDKNAVAVSILPYIHPLLDLQSSDKALTLQSSFARKQLASAEEETDRLIRRLADESHLVVPGASTGQAWQKASDVAHESAEQTVQSKLQTAERAASVAREMMKSINALPKAFEGTRPQ